MPVASISEAFKFQMKQFRRLSVGLWPSAVIHRVFMGSPILCLHANHR